MKNLLAIAGFTACISACSSPGTQTNPFMASVDSVMNSAVDTARFNGNVLIARNGEIVYQKSFGAANFYTHEMLNDSSVFELASVSKAFTAMAIMMLKEQGKLSYEDDVRKYIPELSYEGITIRHFLTHTSGIADYGDVLLGEGWEGWDPKKIATNDDIVAAFAKQKPPVLFKPGEKWEYSNTAYALLATIVQRVSGKQFGEFLSENIFVPLDMKHSRIYKTRRSGEVLPNYAYGFIYTNNKYSLPDSLPGYHYVYSLDGIEGDGVVNSTTGDLFKWNKALYTDKLVSKTTLEEAFTPAKLDGDTVHRYGFGWAIENDPKQGKIVRHTGSWPGYRNLIIRFLDSGDCIIVLANTENPSARNTVGKELQKRLGWFK
ncbi:MAG TPA: serine hydrolase domain-containing protein [Cyclobacteriaceae bacterium]